MPRIQQLALLFALTAVCAHQATTQRQGDATPDQTASLTEVCLGCICEASTSCDRARGCAAGVCGLFAITRPYWMDAGRPLIAGDAPKRAKAFERCAVDPFCAATAVRAYMRRYAKDCDGDGTVTCQDFAAIHALGAEGCGGEVSPGFLASFDTCFRRYSKGSDP